MSDSQIQKSDKHVFLLGAGFSVSYGPPVMKDFMAIARSKYFPLRERNSNDPRIVCYEKLMKFQQECKKCSWAVNRDWDDIEELYTQADLLRLARYPDDSQAEELCRQIAWTIWDVYRSYENDKQPPMNHVLENLNDQGHRPIIITTNYDVLCEIGITSGNPHWQYYYPGFRLPWTPTEKNQSVLEENVNIGIESLLGMKAVPIIKLHGSINWFQGGKGNTSLFATTEFGHYDKKFSNLIGLSRPEFEIKYIKGWMGAIGLVGSDPVPAIIPPMLGKMSISPIISRQWQSAIRCLETAADITVIGYSFPETDTFMTRLLAEGLKNNNGLEQITIVDIQDEGQWAERLERIFATTLRKTKLKFQMSDSKKYLISLAKKRGNEGTAVVITSPSY